MGKRVLSVMVVMLGLVVGTAAAGVIPIYNPSFDLPDVPSGDWGSVADSGWSAATPSLYFVYDPSDPRFSGTNGDNANSEGVLPDGGQIANLDRKTVYQVVGVTQPYTMYTLTFWIGTSKSDGVGTYGAELLDDGVAFATDKDSGPVADSFVQLTLIGQTGASVSGDLSIQFSHVGAGIAWLDMVELSSEEYTLAPVPEPAGLGLIGLAALGLRRKRR